MVAIFSLHHTPVGKTTQARPHTAAAHVRYITREKALSRIAAARMPCEPGAAAAYLRAMEDGDRKNARVADKVMLALPKELDQAGRVALVRDFAEALTRGRAVWFAAFHEQGKDAENPHCHLVIRDRDHETGKRVIGMSEAGSTEKLRALWEEHANNALERAGERERIDRRSLKARGFTRDATIHEGVRARRLAAEGRPLKSRPINRRNGIKARSRLRRVDYPNLDAGRTRVDQNRMLQERRQEAIEREYWATIDQDIQGRNLGSGLSSGGGQATAREPTIEELMAFMSGTSSRDRER